MSRSISFKFLAILIIFCADFSPMFGQPPPPLPPLAIDPGALPPGTPQPPKPCLDDIAVLGTRKFLNDSCQYDDDCGYPMICLKNKCTCRDDYFPKEVTIAGTTRFTCQIAPMMGSSCTDQCQKPLTCVNVDKSNDKSSKRCDCLSPAKLINGLCQLECKDDDIYESGECKKRCGLDEVKIDGRGCMKKSAIGASCDDSRQCSAAFSECSSGICTCKNGFSANKGKCDSKTYTCPTGDPIMSNGQVVKCKLIGTTNLVMLDIQTRSVAAIALPPPPPQMPSPLTDTCGDGQYCLLEGNVPTMAGASGHCCPKVKPQCPIGTPHQTASCETKTNGTKCPSSSHYCYQPGGYTSGGVCCPQACPSGTTLVDGQCLAPLRFGDPCLADEQCRGHNGACVNGKCACGATTTLDDTLNKYCRAHCNADEIEQNNKCYPRFKLGDTCQPGTTQCPANAYCNSKNVCVCRCGFLTLGDRICGPQPMCRNPGFGIPIPMPIPLASEPRIPSDRDSVVKPRAEKSNFTFCKSSPGSKSPLATAVDQCPDGETCMSYVQNVGLCCPTPKPTCPNGATLSDQKCDPKVPGGCGTGAYCQRYFTPANSTDTSLGFICCKQSGFPIPLALPTAVTP